MQDTPVEPVGGHLNIGSCPFAPFTSNQYGNLKGGSRRLSMIASDLGSPFPIMDKYEASKSVCKQLNGYARGFDDTIPDVRVQYTFPETAHCSPCPIKYSVSASVKEGQYISIGWKGFAWNRKHVPKRPNYFGMTTDEGTMILAHPSSSGVCVREMAVHGYTSAPEDIQGNMTFSDYAAQFVNGQLQITFTKEEFWGNGPDQLEHAANHLRLQWAIGDRFGADNCTASLGYHASQRGVSHLNWFGMHTPCSEPITESWLSNAYSRVHDKISVIACCFLAFVFRATL